MVRDPCPGGVEVHNLVPPADAFQPLAEGLAVSTLSASEFREATMSPPAISDILGTIPAGQALVADAVSEDGAWARVVFDDRPVWVAVSALDPAVSLASLPVIGPTTFTPMQSICLGNPRGNGACGSNAPSLLIVQSPGDFPVDIRVQETNFRLQGTVTFRMVGNRLEMTVVNGIAMIAPDTVDEVRIPAGFTINAQVGQVDDTGCAPLTGPWSAPRQLNEGDLNQLAIVERIPSNLFNDEIILPEIIRPSGVGGVRPQIQLNDRVSQTIVPPACQLGQVAADLCASIAL